MTSWFEAVPKVELHLHLEGAIPLDALFALIEKYGGTKETPDLSALRRRFQYRDFPTFIDTWVWKNGFLREYDDFTLIAEAVARDLARQNTRYAEAFFSPADFARHGLTAQKLAEALRRGLDRVAGVRVQLIADLVRDLGPVQAARTLREVNEARGFGIVGVGLGGSEQDYPAPPFAAVFAEARRLDLRLTAHGGEAAGPESIWAVIRDLEAERIGHGTRAHEDEALVDFLAERQIPLEVCPSSNVATGIVPSFCEHPIARYVERGLKVTVSTDDPAMFNCALATELAQLESELGFPRDQVRELILNGVDAAFLSPEEKRGLRRELEADPGWSL